MAEKLELKGIKHKIVVMSGKGGVGKSTVAVNLAAKLSQKGYKVGLLDCDIHGPSVPKMLGVEGARFPVFDETIEPVIIPPSLKVVSIAFLLPESDTPVIWRGPMKFSITKQFLEKVDWGDLDYLIIDLPPGTGDEALNIAHLIASIDGAVIVSTPQDVALLSVRKSINFAKKLNIPVIGLIENMSGFACPNCGKEFNVFGKGNVERVCKEMDLRFLGYIPIDPAVAESGDYGEPFVVKYPESASSKAFDGIVDKVLEFVEAVNESNESNESGK
ncbi:ATPases involved in chromosome partitioning [Archaeoglobus sulfaticallidus PM70-1]|uniref:Iron-sulfur cluster carrier protein n=1 Tax=Archaeoglobus sulfaticallidus PM70-1 TaxID=387631 RepID=N0BND4_9EURY|nr:Mrp/NBP35 family ATP-binding protein [Archaeoglobus sulfaticallidus]AGK62156.1 ATPases involved in chromosome partitioning [Archaeoglobus sulfaticallidus PM70-1]